jgi:hypothetical protein
MRKFKEKKEIFYLFFLSFSFPCYMEGTTQLNPRVCFQTATTFAVCPHFLVGMFNF